MTEHTHTHTHTLHFSVSCSQIPIPTVCGSWRSEGRTQFLVAQSSLPGANQSLPVTVQLSGISPSSWTHPPPFPGPGGSLGSRPWGDGRGGLGPRSPLVGPPSSLLLLLKCPGQWDSKSVLPAGVPPGDCPQGPRPCPSADQAWLSSPCTEVQPQLPSGAQLRRSFPQPSPAHGAALSQLTEPVLPPSSTPPAKRPRDRSPGPGSRPPGVTPHRPFLLCPMAPPKGLFRALNVEWESRPSSPTPLSFSEMCLLSAPPYLT